MGPADTGGPIRTVHRTPAGHRTLRTTGLVRARRAVRWPREDRHSNRAGRDPLPPARIRSGARRRDPGRRRVAGVAGDRRRLGDLPAGRRRDRRSLRDLVGRGRLAGRLPDLRLPVHRPALHVQRDQSAGVAEPPAVPRRRGRDRPARSAPGGAGPGSRSAGPRGPGDVRDQPGPGHRRFDRFSGARRSSNGWSTRPPGSDLGRARAVTGSPRS